MFYRLRDIIDERIFAFQIKLFIRVWKWVARVRFIIRLFSFFFFTLYIFLMSRLYLCFHLAKIVFIEFIISEFYCLNDAWDTTFRLIERVSNRSANGFNNPLKRVYRKISLFVQIDEDLCIVWDKRLRVRSRRTFVIFSHNGKYIRDAFIGIYILHFYGYIYIPYIPYQYPSVKSSFALLLHVPTLLPGDRFRYIFTQMIFYIRN